VFLHFIKFLRRIEERDELPSITVHRRNHTFVVPAAYNQIHTNHDV
jgi:hypothetical protein